MHWEWEEREVQGVLVLVVPPTEIRMQGVREQAGVPCMCILRCPLDIRVDMSHREAFR